MRLELTSIARRACQAVRSRSCPFLPSGSSTSQYVAVHPGTGDSLPELWDIDRVCAYLACTRHLVYRLTRERRISFVRVGKELRFRAADVAAWLEVESVPTQSAQPKPARPRRGRPRNRDRAA
jgi:excisionase family DNA binding protein